MKTLLKPPSHLKIWKSLPSLLAGAASLGIATTAFAQYNVPYAPGSTADKQLNFNNGAANSITAPNPTYVVGLGYSTAPATGTGGGWTLQSTGAVAYGVGLPPFDAVLGRSNANTDVNGSQLSFNIVTSGLGELASASLPMTWSATSSITDSNTWTSPSNQYRYQFDVLLSNSLLSGSPDIFGGITLTIKAGASTLYQQTGLAQILGITSIESAAYDDVKVGFTYNQASGPLEITWSASSTINATLLGILGDGSNTMYRVSDGEIAVAVPEPSTYALMIGAIGSFYLLRRRRSMTDPLL